VIGLVIVGLIVLRLIVLRLIVLKVIIVGLIIVLGSVHGLLRIVGLSGLIVDVVDLLDVEHLELVEVRRFCDRFALQLGDPIVDLQLVVLVVGAR